MSAHPEPDVASATFEPVNVAPSLLDAVRDLHRDVLATSFPLEIQGVAEARASRVRLMGQLSDHLLPRLVELSAPAVVVLAGSTGAGKSTLMNSLLGAELSEAGVLRPTTRQPVIAHHPEDGELLAGHPVLEAVKVVSNALVPRGIALLDAPDLDSVLEENRTTAHRLLEAADLWLFVTTAARYGDALPWQVLAGAMERGASVAMVLNRVPPESLSTVRGDLLTRLRSRGMQGVPLFVVPDVGPHEGLLDPGAVAPIKRWLTMLAGPDRARSVIVRTLRGSLGALRPWVDAQAEAVQDQVDAAAALRAEITLTLDGPAASARAGVLAGTVADGAVQARWTELAAGAGPLSRVVRPSGRIRGLRRTGRAREEALAGVLDDLRRSAGAVLNGAGVAAERALRSHLGQSGSLDGGRALVGAWPADERRAARDAHAEVSAGEWTLEAKPLVGALLTSTEPGVAKRSARVVRALGVHGLEIVALTAAAGLSRADDLLTALLGDSAAGLRNSLRDSLADRAEQYVRGEGVALAALLDVADLADDAASRLRLRLAVLKGLM
ncbi:GTPase [Pengzhenrongella phosphoraccumulans]|uniref:GTPase n=1 Tax=Pengzhenrongella phosphoraccumulans TaxID=3114394 RepID=UPI0038903C1F